jgi:peptidoglycan/LPS O-acetylase OafA/YrhL
MLQNVVQSRGALGTSGIWILSQTYPTRFSNAHSIILAKLQLLIENPKYHYGPLPSLNLQGRDMIRLKPCAKSGVSKISEGKIKDPQGVCMMNLKYRKDIDGLRAISVISVLLTHADIGLFSGGFIGVDVFFVISGYLITTIIVKEILSGEFSLIRFYERRIRRILPALFVVVAFTIVVCAIMYDAEKLKDFGKSVLATTLFVSNINFFKESGNFDAPSQLKPLLHTWSLAVEEQFYIFFPLFMFVLYRFAKKLAPMILAGTAIFSHLGLPFTTQTLTRLPHFIWRPCVRGNCWWAVCLP